MLTCALQNIPVESYALKARWVFPVECAPIPDGVVSVEQGRITAVGQEDVSRPIIDLGNAAILPGLVNAHCHLEFSELERPLGFAGMSFPDWIREVVEYRRRRHEETNNIEQRKHEIVAGGARECLAHGTTTLGDIRTAPLLDGTASEAPLQCTMFRELIGLSQERAGSALRDVTEWLVAFERGRFYGRPALSPHAPYSVSSNLLEKTISLSAERRLPLAMHLAESIEELELLSSHSGPFVEMFTQSGFWDPGAVPRGQRPLDLLVQLERAYRVLVIHGNYLASDEISFLGDHADHMSVVYCPRTHAYFDCGQYPLEEMLDAGVNVALGTDSRASNPNLSLLEEMRFVADRFPELPRERVLELGTLSGAVALGLDSRIGSLSAGKQADLCVVALTGQDADPYALLSDSKAIVATTVLRGRLAS